ncbi:amidase signature enzyme [Lentinula edodes]|uniref:Amidase signature enzyme n=1 Tax=Lentinula edodes TaxID=5353 RepID=A0A1Q3EEX1_LENED|nr:amidase signature enzyme [Lentinula edodes]
MPLFLLKIHQTCSSQTKPCQPHLLKEAGARIAGKTNCDEFGMGSLNIHSIHGPVINPFDVDSRRAAGGSSGGSAAAVAAGLCDAALGTDTGGSIRLPASYCGVVGLKPSYGLLSRHGVVSYADSLDTVGVLAQNVQKVKKVFGSINKRDFNDPTSCRREQLSKPLRWDPTYAHSRSQGFGSEVKKRILLGTYALGADAFDNYFLQAQRVRQMVRNDFDHVFSIPNVLYTENSSKEDLAEPGVNGVDVLIHPSAIRTAPRLDDVLDTSRERDTLQDYVQDVLTVPASLSGLPALSVPMQNRSKSVAFSLPTYTDGGFLQEARTDEDGDAGWPIGVSIVGQWGTDELVLRVGQVIERLSRG